MQRLLQIRWLCLLLHRYAASGHSVFGKQLRIGKHLPAGP
jgi:hypothetical protein